MKLSAVTVVFHSCSTEVCAGSIARGQLNDSPKPVAPDVTGSNAMSMPVLAMCPLSTRGGEPIVELGLELVSSVDTEEARLCWSDATEDSDGGGASEDFLEGPEWLKPFLKLSITQSTFAARSRASSAAIPAGLKPGPKCSNTATAVEMAFRADAVCGLTG